MITIRIHDFKIWRSHNGVVINLQWQETFHTVWLSGHWGSCGYRSRPIEPDNPVQRRRIKLWRFCNITF